MSKLIKDQTQLFSYIDNDFENWNIDEGIEKPTGELKSIEQTKDFTFKDVFNPETDCVTQEEVIKFVEENKDTDVFNYIHFFLLKNSEGRFFVAYVVYFYGDDSFRVRVFRFENSPVWDTSNHHRLVAHATSPLILKNQPLSPSEPVTISEQEMIDTLKSKGYIITKQF